MGRARDSRGWLFFAAWPLAASGCLSTEDISWPDGAELDVVFVISLDESGERPERVHGSHVRNEDGAFEQAVLSLPPGSRLMFVAVDVDAVQAPPYRVRVEDPDAFEMSIGGESCDQGNRVGDVLQIGLQHLGLDSGVTFLEPDDEGMTSPTEASEELRSNLVLSVPIDDHWCPEEAVLRPFGAAGSLLPRGTSLSLDDLDLDTKDYPVKLRTLGSMALLDDNRIFALSDYAAFLFRRGEAFVERVGENVLPVPGNELLESPMAFRRLLHHRRENAPDQLVALARADFEAAMGSTLFVFEVTDQAMTVRTATRSPHLLSEVAYEPASGLFVAVASDGVILTAPSADGPYVRATIQGDLGDFGAVVATGDESTPLLITGMKSQIFQVDSVAHGEISLREVDTVNTGQSLGSPVIELDGDRRIAWMSTGSRGVDTSIFTASVPLGPDGFTPVPYLLPTELEQCIVPEPREGACGRRENVGPLVFLLAHRSGGGVRRIFGVQAECPVLVSINISKSCTSFFGFEGIPHTGTPRTESFGGIVQGERSVYVSGNEGRLYELVLP